MTATSESSLCCINADCCICLDTLNNHIITDIEVTQCGHMFHGTCFASWLQRGRNCCPLCRTRVTNGKIAPRPVTVNSSRWQMRTNEIPRLPDLVPAISPRSTHYVSDDGTRISHIILPPARTIRTIDFQSRFSESAEPSAEPPVIPIGHRVHVDDWLFDVEMFGNGAEDVD